MKELITRIKDDIKKAEIRRDAFDKDSCQYEFNRAIIIALKTVLFDMKELRLTDED
jgi:hypothetical protein